MSENNNLRLFYGSCLALITTAFSFSIRAGILPQLGADGGLALAGAACLQPIGCPVAGGILLAAFVMSMFLVPALTALMGHSAWWPGHGDVASNGGAAAHPSTVDAGAQFR